VNCAGFHAALGPYFHGPAEPGRDAEVDRHAAECGPCGELMRIAREISCRDFVSFLDDYIADELPPERRAVFERHLGICPDCTAYVDAYRKTMALGALALRDASPLPPQMPEELIRAIVAASKG
jgi:putative zinc finger protein